MEIDDVYREHGHHSFFDFWLCEDGDELTEEEFRLINATAAAWSSENDIPCELARLADGFQVELVHLCHSGTGIAGNLFLFLAKNAFRKIEKGFAYGPKRAEQVK
jgi:hypothetical protein